MKKENGIERKNEWNKYIQKEYLLNQMNDEENDELVTIRLWEVYYVKLLRMVQLRKI